MIAAPPFALITSVSRLNANVAAPLFLSAADDAARVENASLATRPLSLALDSALGCAGASPRATSGAEETTLLSLGAALLSAAGATYPLLFLALSNGLSRAWNSTTATIATTAAEAARPKRGFQRKAQRGPGVALTAAAASSAATLGRLNATTSRQSLQSAK